MINATDARILTYEAKAALLAESIKQYEQIMANRKKVITNTASYCETTLSSLITDAAQEGLTAVTIKIGQAYYIPSDYGEDYKLYGIIKDEGETYANGRHSWCESSKIGKIDLQTLVTIIESCGYTVTQEKFQYFRYYEGKRNGLALTISWAK